MIFLFQHFFCIFLQHFCHTNLLTTCLDDLSWLELCQRTSGFATMMDYVISCMRDQNADDSSNDDSDNFLDSSEDMQSHTDSEGSTASSFSSIGATINRL
jgi:hypothetical protein